MATLLAGVTLTASCTDGDKIAGSNSALLGVYDMSAVWDASTLDMSDGGADLSVCTSACSGVACGADDGCGGTCCSGSGCLGVFCNSSACQTANSCGSACVATPDGTACFTSLDAPGTCESGSCVCTPSCGANACGSSDGCGGTCCTGTTADGGACDGTQCTTSDGHTGSCSGSICTCTPSCSNALCGDPDGCGGTCCLGSGCSPVTCPDCQTMDSCGGYCVAVPDGTSCTVSDDSTPDGGTQCPAGVATGPIAGQCQGGSCVGGIADGGVGGGTPCGPPMVAQPIVCPGGRTYALTDTTETDIVGSWANCDVNAIDGVSPSVGITGPCCTIDCDVIAAANQTQPTSCVEIDDNTRYVPPWFSSDTPPAPDTTLSFQTVAEAAPANLTASDPTTNTVVRSNAFPSLGTADRRAVIVGSSVQSAHFQTTNSLTIPPPCGNTTQDARGLVGDDVHSGWFLGLTGGIKTNFSVLVSLARTGWGLKQLPGWGNGMQVANGNDSCNAGSSTWPWTTTPTAAAAAIVRAPAGVGTATPASDTVFIDGQINDFPWTAEIPHTLACEMMRKLAHLRTSIGTFGDFHGFGHADLYTPGPVGDQARYQRSLAYGGGCTLEWNPRVGQRRIVRIAISAVALTAADLTAMQTNLSNFISTVGASGHGWFVHLGYYNLYNAEVNINTNLLAQIPHYIDLPVVQWAGINVPADLQAIQGVINGNHRLLDIMSSGDLEDMRYKIMNAAGLGMGCSAGWFQRPTGTQDARATRAAYICTPRTVVADFGWSVMAWSGAPWTRDNYQKTLVGGCPHPSEQGRSVLRDNMTRAYNCLVEQNSSRGPVRNVADTSQNCITRISTGPLVNLYQSLRHNNPIGGATATGVSSSGYKFTPSRGITVRRLGGYFPGTRTVYLYNASTHAVLSSASVTSSTSWAYTPLTTPVALTSGTAYSVAVYNSSGNPYLQTESLPLNNADATINQGCDTGTNVDPTRGFCYTNLMQGIADFTYSVP
jgi:hypothetical protein